MILWVFYYSNHITNVIMQLRQRFKMCPISWWVTDLETYYSVLKVGCKIQGFLHPHGHTSDSAAVNLEEKFPFLKAETKIGLRSQKFRKVLSAFLKLKLIHQQSVTLWTPFLGSANSEVSPAHPLVAVIGCGVWIFSMGVFNGNQCMSPVSTAVLYNSKQFIDPHGVSINRTL